MITMLSFALGAVMLLSVIVIVLAYQNLKLQDENDRLKIYNKRESAPPF